MDEQRETKRASRRSADFEFPTGFPGRSLPLRKMQSASSRTRWGEENGMTQINAHYLSNIKDLVHTAKMS